MPYWFVYFPKCYYTQYNSVCIFQNAAVSLTAMYAGFFYLYIVAQKKKSVKISLKIWVNKKKHFIFATDKEHLLL
jgi:hypothetical protein